MCNMTFIYKVESVYIIFAVSNGASNGVGDVIDKVFESIFICVIDGKSTPRDSIPQN